MDNCKRFIDGHSTKQTLAQLFGDDSWQRLDSNHCGSMIWFYYSEKIRNIFLRSEYSITKSCVYTTFHIYDRISNSFIDICLIFSFSMKNTKIFYLNKKGKKSNWQLQWVPQSLSRARKKNTFVFTEQSFSKWLNYSQTWQ